MNQLSLNQTQLLSFINWSESNLKHKGQKAIIKKLSNIGMENIIINGRWKNTTYTFNTPPLFWEALQIPSLNYSPMVVDCLTILIDGNIVNGIVMFHSEYYEELAKKHGTTKKAVEITFSRLKKYIKDLGLLNVDYTQKSHRIKLDNHETWVTGNKAIRFDQKIRGLWVNWFEQHKEVDKDNNDLLLKWMREFYINGIPRIMGGYYRTVKLITVDKRFLLDAEWARLTFFNTLNMDIVRKGITERQMIYKEEVQREKDRLEDKRKSDIEKFLQSFDVEVPI